MNKHIEHILLIIAAIVVPLFAFADSGNQPGSIAAAGNYPLALRRETPVVHATVEGYNSVLATNRYGDLFCAIRGGANGIAQIEDAPHTSGDLGVLALGIANPQLGGAVCSSTSDYCPKALNVNGAQYMHLYYDNSANSAVTIEDKAAVSGDAGIAPLAVFRSSATQSAGTANDYSTVNNDVDGRVYVNPFGSAPSEFVSGCNGAVTTATTGAMIAADASNRFYISSWSCTNTGATASRVILEDGDGTDFANLFLPATTGFASVTFPIPVRLGAINKAAQINVITSGSSTICCANGFKSPN